MKESVPLVGSRAASPIPSTWNAADQATHDARARTMCSPSSASLQWLEDVDDAEWIRSALAIVAISAAILDSEPTGFTFRPAGELVSGSGQGRVDNKVYLPNMRFPLESPAAYANSQVWGTGGSQGPGGSQCAPVNYSYPWHDNFCELRTHEMPLCPSGTGHQGQDIRPSTCERDKHWVV